MRDIDYDISRVDFNWLEKTNSIKELKRAYQAIKLDGGKNKRLNWPRV